MQKTINRNLLKHAAGTAIFCPSCEVCMDWTRTVLLTYPGAAKVACTKCWDKVSPKVLAVLAEAAVPYEVLDARKL